MISFDSVTKKFGQSNALTNLTFSIAEKEVVGLIGNNGAGKSTLIHLLANLLQLNSGEIYVFERKLKSNYLSYKSKTGFILSKPFYVEDFSAKEYLKFVGKFQKIPPKQLTSKSEDLFRELNFTEFEKPISKLSKGNQMKVSVIASLIHNPSLLLYDEPFVNLDVDSQETLKSLLKSMKCKKTILITSHNLDLVLDICDRFLVLDHGKLILDTPKREPLEELKKEITGLLHKSKEESNLDWLK